MLEKPSWRLDQRIEVLENEIKDTHPKSHQLQILVQIKERVKKTENKFRDVTFGLIMGELLLGTLAITATLPEKNTEKILFLAGGTITAFMVTSITSLITGESVRQRMISSELSRLDQGK